MVHSAPNSTPPKLHHEYIHPSTRTHHHRAHDHASPTQVLQYHTQPLQHTTNTYRQCPSQPLESAGPSSQSACSILSALLQIVLVQTPPARCIRAQPPPHTKWLFGISQGWFRGKGGLTAGIASFVDVISAHGFGWSAGVHKKSFETYLTKDTFKTIRSH